MTQLKYETRIVIPSNQEARALTGELDQNLRLMESAFPVRILSRGNELLLAGEAVDREHVKGVIEDLLAVVQRGEPLTEHDVRYAIRAAEGGDRGVPAETIFLTHRGKAIRAKTAGQTAYVEAIRQHDLVFGIGPAGTGKTYLAVAMAVAALKNREVLRIILARPAVEAGEKLGFLPGDLREKVDPYLRPLYDALFDMLGVETYERYLERGTLEIAPLAYMRGRTLDDSFVILDEAQNTTPEQMKMFLTRLGFGAKAVVTGDVTQVDLPRGSFSGLRQAQEVLAGIEGIAFVELGERDVVRHRLVQEIIKAYERHEDTSVDHA